MLSFRRQLADQPNTGNFSCESLKPIQATHENIALFACFFFFVSVFVCLFVLRERERKRESLFCLMICLPNLSKINTANRHKIKE